MGWRFRKSFRLAPGVRLNLGRRGITSMSVGRRGATVNLGKRGVTGTVSIPGTGLSYQHRFTSLPTKHKSGQANPATVTATRGPAASGLRAVSRRTYLIIAILLGLGYLVVHSLNHWPISRSDDQSGGQTTDPAPTPSQALAAIGGSTVEANTTEVSPVPQHAVEADASLPTAIRKATVIKSANVRTAPSVAGAVVGVLPKGAAVEVLQSENGWFRVRGPTGEAFGWVHGSLLR